jgi:RsmE family RNA methyltransferase
VNLVLFTRTELAQPLPRSDRRAEHILRVLRRDVGDSFDAGLINGPRGKATLVSLSTDALTLAFEPTTEARAPAPIHLLVGLPRPQTARDILRDATTLGVGSLHFVRTEKGERSYAHSSLWSSGEWQRHLIAGAEQAFATDLPVVTHHVTLAEALTATRFPAQRLALDNYEAAGALGAHRVTADLPIVVAIGAERGWSGAEREQLRADGYRLAHLGSRVLRTETAVAAALAILRAKLGLM